MPSISGFNIISDSKISSFILKNTPFLSNTIDNSLKVYDELEILLKKYKKSNDKEKLNLETLDLLLKYKATTTSVVSNLQNKGKINIKNINSVLNKYMEE